MTNRTDHRASYVLASLFLACSSGDGGAGPNGVLEAKSALTRNEAPSTENVQTLGAGNRAFAFELFQAVAAKHVGENLLFSPYSVSTALAMAYAGARSTTASEMKSVLHFDLEQPALHEAFDATDLSLTARGQSADGAAGTPFQLHVDNSVWAQQGFSILPAFLDTLAVNYGASVYTVDFSRHTEAARLAINHWVAERTEQRIPELLLPGILRATTRLVLTNAIYFDASWQTTFDPKNTLPTPFTKLDGSTVDVAMMNLTTEGTTYAETDDYQAVALPYSSAGLALIAVLPKSAAYAAVEASANAAWFEGVYKKLALTPLKLGFPKLSYDAHISLKETLEDMGMFSAFSAADFTGISDPSLVIQDVIHQANIDVSETGTVAAAATAVLFGRKSALPQADNILVFDRPFLFAIYDSMTGSVLFLGRVLDPSAAP